MSLKDVKAMKGLGDKDQLMDRAGPLELSANDFQMLSTAKRSEANSQLFERTWNWRKKFGQQ